MTATSSGIQNFFLSNGELVFEAFDRIGMRPGELTQHHLSSARRSLNLEFQRLSNLGINLWEIVQAQITLVAGQATYALPTNLVTITEMNYTTLNGGGVGINTDRIMLPITRTQYAMIPNKLTPGNPSQFWLERLETPLVTLYQAPYAGSPAFLVNYYYLQRAQDARLGSGETPDIVYRGLDALCAALAKRLAIKFAPPPVIETAKAEATEAWNDFVTNDQENGPMIMQPNLSSYGRMR